MMTHHNLNDNVYKSSSHVPCPKIRNRKSWWVWVSALFLKGHAQQQGGRVTSAALPFHVEHFSVLVEGWRERR